MALGFPWLSPAPSPRPGLALPAAHKLLAPCTSVSQGCVAPRHVEASDRTSGQRKGSSPRPCVPRHCAEGAAWGKDSGLETGKAARIGMAAKAWGWDLPLPSPFLHLCCQVGILQSGCESSCPNETWTGFRFALLPRPLIPALCPCPVQMSSEPPFPRLLAAVKASPREKAGEQGV